VHGVVYVHCEGRLSCQVTFLDVEPGYQESEEICTASLLTLRKKK
jgi:hypothetical protein